MKMQIVITHSHALYNNERRFRIVGTSKAYRLLLNLTNINVLS